MRSGIVLGVVTGLTTGMLAVGLVLVYKASRFVNLAHGQLGALSAVLLATWVGDWNWSWWIAFPIVVALGAALGVGVEALVIRPLRRQRRRGVTLLLVTIGVGQLLLALTFIPALNPDPTRLFREQYPLPFTTHFEFGGADLTGEDVMILLLVPVVVAALGAFLRYTTLGKSIRAAASNPDAARLCGISVERVNAITWGIAGALSAITAVLLAPGQSSFNAGALGPALLLRALGAAALGGFVSIPAALIGGIGLGVVEHVTLSITSKGSSAELAVFVAVMIVLLARGRLISSAAGAEEEQTAEDRPPTRVPDAVAGRFVVRSHRSLLGISGVVVASVLPLLPYFSRENHRFQLVLILVFATVAVGLTMLIGWAGQVSLGHFALVGVGAYVAARLGPEVSLLAIVFIAGVAGAAVMAVVGLPALRLRGLTLAVTTLGLAVAGPAWLFVQPWFGAEGQAVVRIGDLGMSGIGHLRSQLSTYYVALALLALTAVAAGTLRRSIPGRLVVAARDNDLALASFGIAPATVKLSILAVSGFVAASAGVLWGVAWDSVSVDLVAPPQSLAMLAIPVVGGLGSIAGTVLAAFVIYMPAFFVAPLLTGVFGEFGRNLGFQLALGGLGLVAMPLLYPAGIAGMAQEGWERLLRSLEREVGRWRPRESHEPLQVRDVSVHFGGIHALDRVSIDVHPGEIVGLIGPNGAGKTTLINVISGHLRPAAGAVKVQGHDVTDLAPELRSGFGLGRSYQHARLFPGLTVAEVVQVALSRTERVGFLSSLVSAPWARSLDRRSRRQAEELLATLGLTVWADTLTANLSTGMRRMTDLAMQIAASPKVLLLDEPTAGVAQREAEAFGPMLRRIRQQLDCSILIVEHDMPLLMGLCDRIYAMEEGGIIAVGSPEEIRDDPVVIASYLGTDVVTIERSGARSSATRAVVASRSRAKVRGNGSPSPRRARTGR